ncbi:hypothetical protein MKX64_15545 [Paenibacillus sp. FSL M8-0334]|uniref:DUF7408 domain-containing protein n=1 Tax=Paenibacillus campinasensis TaxID=66347 RepID=A0A268EWW0_9BACL|nr:hypothetical protein [Paenibacillus campinasensis]MUG68331.1 hypothetical protein [Paenibacillus campinasensis]PAD77607.1 hypothetical protein CHH67_09080 [Paenibacillus campinasensis]
MSLCTRSLRGLSLWVMALLVLAASLFTGSGTANADAPKIQIQTELGYKGKLKEGKWNPLKITLTSDQDIAGDIVVQIQSYQGMGIESSYVQYVELPKDTPKEVVIGIPGGYLNKDNNQILFYEKSYTEGQPIPFDLGRNYLQSSQYSGALIAVLSDDPDTMNFMNALNGRGNSLNTVPLKAEELPDQAQLLNGLDVLVINNFASDTLSAAQQEAIAHWVSEGGTLVLSGGAGYVKSAAPFADIAPVQWTGTTTVQSLPELEKLGGKPLSLQESYTISTATPVEGAESQLEGNGNPLIVSKSQGMGQVMYAAYDLALEPVASWGGHADAWASILRGALPLVNPGGMGYYQPMLESLGYVTEYFPSLKMPSFQLLLWMLIGYAVIVGPLLYFILKKVDKREWAWLLIPALAVVASGTVYTVGSSDRTEEMAHTINVIEMDGEGSALKSSVSAFFSPRSGNYTLEFPKNTYLRAGGSSNSFGGSRLGDNNTYIRAAENETLLEFRNMPQWSLGKVYMQGQGYNEAGKLTSDIRLDAAGQIVGQVTNETKSDLENVVLVMGGKAYRMGDIKQGESAEVPQDKAQILTTNHQNLSNLLYPYTNNDVYNREREVLSMYSYSPTNIDKTSTYIFGWSKDHLTNYTRAGKEVSSDQLNFWVQPIQMGWALNEGEITIPYGFLTPEVTQVNSPIFGTYVHGVELGQGTMIMEFPLLPGDDVKYSEISIKGTRVPGVATMELWNASSGEWEPMTQQNSVHVIADNPEQYIVNNKIRIMISTSDHVNFMMPELSLKGESQHD